ncbi:TetR/AcrR family transcriptional regulator [Sphingobacterium thalpophilum]|uniref:HTH-type transcriptional regulator qacR n=1 Tax=Sphingobacterium thalpophilum TaxID=259 RepID=A0A4U9VDU2_9SPHI|nr:TetR/AcrR family transcriptional regulator [Sphingobacterium thalpophilum]VTR41141.1 HTH-type transcriptional regulator qacR [Sphingobacterium thalpophilum]
MNTKDQILQAAEEMFYQKGYPLTTIRDIANKAKMNSAMIHYHYGSKEILFLTLLKKMENGLNNICLKRSSVENDMLIKAFIIDSLKETCSRHKVFHLYLKEQSQPSTEEIGEFVERLKHKHFNHFSSLVQVQNKQSTNKITNKRAELIYYSVFGMIKELFRSHKIKTNNEDRENNNLIDIETVIMYIDKNI